MVLNRFYVLQNLYHWMCKLMPSFIIFSQALMKFEQSNLEYVGGLSSELLNQGSSKLNDHPTR